jgi:diguanylate cyclase (GGDEF)-like protein/putative nucleotidyltransferase with HDIG domain
MRFHELPSRLRVYLLAHPLLLLPLLERVWRHSPPHQPWLVAALLLFAVLFSTWKVELTVLQGRMTLAFAVVCLTLLLQGSQAAILAAAVGALVGSSTRPSQTRWKIQFIRQPLYRLGFNLANCLLAAGTATLAFQAVVQQPSPLSLAPMVGLIVFTALYFAINTLGVSLAIAYQQELGWFQVWQENFLWTAPGYFASASAAAGIAAAFRALGSWSLLLLPPLYIIYYSYRLYMERLHLYAAKVQQDLNHIQELNQLNQAVIASLASAIDAKDSATCSHINRVQHYALALARAAGLAGPELEAVATAALVHDIGKLGIPDHILGKPGKLTAEEFRRIQSHVMIGAEILAPIPFPFPVVEMVETHHERWDGLGYPQGLKGEAIPLGGRIIAIVDVFDALTSHRPYRRALSPEEGWQIVKDGAGKQFDPQLVARFEQLLPQARAELEAKEAAQQQPGATAPGHREGASALVQINQAAAEMAAVCEVAHALAEQENVEQISRVVVQRALALLPADTAALYLPSGRADELVAAAVEGKYGEKLAGMSIQGGEGATGWVAKTGQPQVNVSAAADIARRFTPEETMELSAVTAVPLVQGPETLGVLAVYTMGYRVLTEQHLNVLNILAEHAAAALQNARRLERQRELAYTDPLTDLDNSRSLVRHLERLTEAGDPPEERRRPEAGPHVFSVVMLDLDRFKQVNDTLGHLHGDELLRQIAQTLRDVARPGDRVCRYAGDEFVLLLPGVGPEPAERVAARVREAVDALPPVEDQVKIGASVGIASFPQDGRDGRTLMQVADQRMYEDKFRRRQSERLLEAAGPWPTAPLGER